MNNYTCHSGGAKGSDLFFERVCIEYGIKVIAYSFDGHDTISKNRKVLSVEELMEGWFEAQNAARDLKRNTYNLDAYVKKLLARNWFQVKNSDAIFAVGNIVNPGEQGDKYINKTSKQVVDGGTGYAVNEAIRYNKPVFVFNQKDNNWYTWKNNKFEKIDYIPELTKNFAGIGTRNLSMDGMSAIRGLFSKLKKNIE